MKCLCIIALLLMILTGANGQNISLRDSLKKTSDISATYPDSVDLRLRKASLNLQLGEWQYAKDEYDYVLAKHPNNLSALYFRAYCNEKLHRYDFARLDYENLLQIVPGNFEGTLGLALLNQKSGRVTEAYDGINRLVNQYPDSSIAYAARAGIEQERKWYELAETDYTKAVSLSPTNTDFINSLVSVLIEEKKYSQARKWLDRLVTLGVPKGTLLDLYKKLK